MEYKLKKEQDTILRGLDMMEQDRAKAGKESVEREFEVRSFEAKVAELEREVEAMKNERREREASLREKELEIGSYKTKVNTLKKFKQVLDFRLREVTLSLQPKDDTIALLSSQVRDLEEKFEENLGKHKDMEAVLHSNDEQIKKDMAECNRLREAIKQCDRTIFQFTEDLRDLATNQTDVRKWPDGLRQIYWKHAKPEYLAKDANGKAMEELTRQIDSTERKASIMKARGKTSEEQSQADIRRKVEENYELIRELEVLRKDRKELQGQVSALELKVKEAEHLQNAAQEAVACIKDRPTTPGHVRTAARSVGAPPVPKSQIYTQRAASSQAPRQGDQLGGGKLRRAGNAHRLPEERKHMQKLLAAVDIRNQQAQMQRLEHKLLQDQYDRLASGSPDLVVGPQ